MATAGGAAGEDPQAACSPQKVAKRWWLARAGRRAQRLVRTVKPSETGASRHPREHLALGSADHPGWPDSSGQAVTSLQAHPAALLA